MLGDDNEEDFKSVASFTIDGEDENDDGRKDGVDNDDKNGGEDGGADDDGGNSQVSQGWWIWGRLWKTQKN